MASGGQGKAGWQVNMNRPDAYYDREMEYYDRETKKHQMNNSFFCQGRTIKTKVILNCSLVNPFSKTISVNGTSIHPAAMLETHVSSLIFSSTTSHIPGVSKSCQLYLQMMSCIHSLVFFPWPSANSSCHRWLTELQQQSLSGLPVLTIAFLKVHLPHTS